MGSDEKINIIVYHKSLSDFISIYKSIISIITYWYLIYIKNTIIYFPMYTPTLSL